MVIVQLRQELRFPNLVSSFVRSFDFVAIQKVVVFERLAFEYFAGLVTSRLCLVLLWRLAL